MLSQCEVMGFIPTRDAEKARGFYVDKLGFQVVYEDGFAVEILSGLTHIRLTKMGEFKPEGHTILGWRVREIEAEVRELSSQGVEFQRYPGLEQDELGIWSSPSGAKVAWFCDPDGNVLSVSQH
jgi:catechol 2,3-dioxygenase-like lactoylglutathione lyase family enzyme